MAGSGAAAVRGRKDAAADPSKTIRRSLSFDRVSRPWGSEKDTDQSEDPDAPKLAQVSKQLLFILLHRGATGLGLELDATHGPWCWELDGSVQRIRRDDTTTSSCACYTDALMRKSLLSSAKTARGVVPTNQSQRELCSGCMSSVLSGSFHRSSSARNVLLIDSVYPVRSLSLNVYAASNGLDAIPSAKSSVMSSSPSCTGVSGTKCTSASRRTTRLPPVHSASCREQTWRASKHMTVRTADASHAAAAVGD